MTSSKRILSLVIAMLMVIGMIPMAGVAAAETEEPIKIISPNPTKAEPFADIAEDDWFYGDVKAVYELGLMVGKGEGTFAPDSLVTIAEAITIAARLNATYTTGADEFETSDPWYKSYADYATENGILTFEVADYNAPAKRAEFALIMANALPEEALEAINAVADGAIPDVAADAEYAAAVYALYRAGIMVGNDEAGTFAPDSEIKRCEVAAITARMADAELRKEVTLGEEETAEPEETTVEPEETTAPEDTTAEPEDTTAPEEEETTAPEADDEAEKELLKELVVALSGINKEEETTAPEEEPSAPEALPITDAVLIASGVDAETVNAGDVLTFTVTPAEATGTIIWTVGGTEIPNHDITYTVTALDLGKTIEAKIIGNGLYTGEASDDCTVASAATVNSEDIFDGEADSNPVVLAGDVDFVDEDGAPVEIAEDATFTLTIEEAEADSEDIEEAIEVVAEKIINDNADVEADHITDLTVTAVNVDLAVDDAPVHPVGAVTVTLSAAQLGLDEGTDLSLYSFTAHHINKAGDDEVVNGELVVIDGVQYIRFVLNGLSTIWIGNVPPRTVRFYNFEEDADAANDNYIGEVIVKFGDLTPTLQIPTPSIDGYIFCGWNYDMTRTPIISNLEVHALWVEGQKMPVDNFDYALTEDADALSVEVDDGFIGFTTDEPLGLPANLKATVTVTAPEDAVKYYVADNADDAAAEHGDEDYTAIADGEISFTFNLTDNDGLLIASTYTKYYKWVDADGNVIIVEEIKVRIANGSDTATSKLFDVDVDRGIGTFEAYLIDSEDETKTYVAYINNGLNGYFADGYTLYNYANFDGYRVDENFLHYDKLKLVFTPFEGESYDEEDVIEDNSYYYHVTFDEEANGYFGSHIDWEGTYEIVDGKLIFTYPFNVKDMNEDHACAMISVNGTEQEIDFNWEHAEDIYGEEEDDGDGNPVVPTRREHVFVPCETWAEVLEALENIDADKNYSINCHGSAAITISSSLTIPANVDISFSGTPSVTVANGVTLTLSDDGGIHEAAHLRFDSGTSFIVDDGGTVSSATAITDGSRVFPGIYADDVTFKSGSRLLVPDDTLFIIAANYNDSELPVCTFEKGSVINCSGGWLLIQNFDTLNLNGTFNLTTHAEFTNDETNIGGSVNISATRDMYGRLTLYGTINIGENGSIVANNTSEYWSGCLLETYGPLTNRGTIEIKGSGYAEIMNNGFANYNMGTISIGAECELYTSGTKFINSGKIIGEGVIYANLGDDYTNYDDGIEYIELEGDVEGYWDEELGVWVSVYKLDEYSRYKYTHDPAKTAKAMIYVSDIVNVGDGVCDVEVIEEELPETIE